MRPLSHSHFSVRVDSCLLPLRIPCFTQSRKTGHCAPQLCAGHRSVRSELRNLARPHGKPRCCKRKRRNHLRTGFRRFRRAAQRRYVSIRTKDANPPTRMTSSEYDRLSGVTPPWLVSKRPSPRIWKKRDASSSLTRPGRSGRYSISSPHLGRTRTVGSNARRIPRDGVLGPDRCRGPLGPGLQNQHVARRPVTACEGGSTWCLRAVLYCAWNELRRANGRHGRTAWAWRKTQFSGWRAVYFAVHFGIQTGSIG
jgi:hypothetical protein